MDGLMVVVALVLWFISQSSKRKKKKNTIVYEKKNSATQRRADRLAHIYNEAEERRTKPVDQPAPKKKQQTPGEGEGGFEAIQNESTEVYASGSLQAQSTEGECICDPALEHVREETIESSSIYAEEIGREPLIDFSAKGVLQGVVMREILKRPAQRVRYR